jgi:uncharacterized membrane protein affecting hemolysin expression
MMGLKGFTKTSVTTQQFKECLTLDDGTEGFTKTSVTTQQFKECLTVEDGADRLSRNVGD